MKKLVLLLLIINFTFSSVYAQNMDEADNLEAKIKAAFIFNFTKYIQWADIDTSGTFKIGIIGESEIIVPLEEMGGKESVNNRKIEIKHFQNIEDINDCDILFISESESNKLQDILKKVEDENILTVGDSKGFAENGAAINFVIVDGKMKFEINVTAIKKAKLQVSSHLLKLAIIVDNGTNE